VASRILPAVLALGFLLQGDPPEDPFILALDGRPFTVRDPAVDRPGSSSGSTWSLRSRREVVDSLALGLLQREYMVHVAGPSGRSVGATGLADPLARRIPGKEVPERVPVTDRLAFRVPGDAAAVFFPSLRSAEDTLEGLARFLPAVFPGVCADGPAGRRAALARAVEALLLPPVWRANPSVRTGTRQVALVVSDPDLRGAPDVALLFEVDDASLVLAHRRASFSWEGRAGRGLRVEGLDAVSDDGSIRSFFTLEGGLAIFATSRSLRDRVRGTATGAPTLLLPDGAAYETARSTFPPADVEALLVVPDAFLRRITSPEVLLPRADALRCEAARLLADAGSLREGGDSDRALRGPPACPVDGRLDRRAGNTGTRCTVHGSAEFPVPLGDLPAPDPDTAAYHRAMYHLLRPEDPLHRGGLPVAARWREDSLEILVPPGEAGAACLELLVASATPDRPPSPASFARSRFDRLAALGLKAADAYRALTGLTFVPDAGAPPAAGPLPAVKPREEGGVLRIERSTDGDFTLDWR